MELPLAIFSAPYSPLQGLEGVRDGVLSAYGSALVRMPKHLLREVRVAWISGCPRASCDAIAEMELLEKLVVYTWGNGDLREISHLRNLKCLAITDSPKLKSLVGIEELVKLEELYLSDCMGYADITLIEKLVALETLCLEGGYSKPLRLKTLGPLAGLKQLRRLRLASIRTEDKSLRPLSQMQALETVFIAKMFPPSEFRLLARERPDLRGEFLDCYRTEG